MYPYKVCIPVRVTRLPRTDGDEGLVATPEIREVELRILAHDAQDAADRLASAISDLLQRVGSG